MVLVLLKVCIFEALATVAFCAGVQDQSARRALPPVDGSLEALRQSTEAAKTALAERRERFNSEFNFRDFLGLDKAKRLAKELYFDFGDPVLNYIWQQDVLNKFGRNAYLGGCDPEARQYLKEELLRFWELGGGRRGRGDPGSSHVLAYTMFYVGQEDVQFQSFAIDVQRYGKRWARETGEDAHILDVPDGFGGFEVRTSGFWSTYVSEAIRKYKFTDEQIRSGRSIYEELQLRLKTHLKLHAKEIEEITQRWEQALNTRTENPKLFDEISRERQLLREPSELHDELVRRLDAIATRAQLAQAEERAKSWQEETAELIQSARKRLERK